MVWLDNKINENYESLYILDSDESGEFITYDSRQVIEIVTPPESIKWN